MLPLPVTQLHTSNCSVYLHSKHALHSTCYTLHNLLLRWLCPTAKPGGGRGRPHAASLMHALWNDGSARPAACARILALI